MLNVIKKFFEKFWVNIPNEISEIVKIELSYIPKIDTSQVLDSELKLWFNLSTKEIEVIRYLETYKIYKVSKYEEIDINIEFWSNDYSPMFYKQGHYYIVFSHKIYIGSNTNLYKALNVIYSIPEFSI